MRTQRGKVQEAGEGDSPEVCGVDDVATIDLGAEHQTPGFMGAALDKELTRRPSASQLFKLNITLGIRPRAVL